MWRHAKDLIAGSFAVSLEDTTAAVRLLLERARIVAEGAAALTVAAAVSGRVEADRVVCIVSGGNIDGSRLTEILAGRVPS
jgi:threonine dehydratase